MRTLLTSLLVLACLVCSPNAAGQPRFLVIVVDGLRPDYVTPALMPNLHALGEAGVVFESHHAVYPTVTRVNSSSISTGAYPTTHGLLGNTVYFPEVRANKGLSTSDHENLLAIQEAEGGRLLTATTLGEALEENGLGVIAISSGSSGSAMLLNHTLRGGGVVNVNAILPASNAEEIEKLVGPAPPDAIPAKERNAWIVDAYIEHALKRLKPAVTLMWFTDPDHTAHQHGVGAPVTVDALAAVDRELGRILDAHRELGLEDTLNVMVTSDHGFSTHVGGFNAFGLLLKHELQARVVQVGGALYVRDRDPATIRSIVELFQQDPATGAIFTRAATAGSYQGWVPGTLSFDAIQWDHARAGDIVVSPAWDSGQNEFGYAGRTTSGGTAGHGSTSRHDIHNTLIAAGPAFKRGIRNAVPSANTDIAPTVLAVLGVDAPASMTGRPLREALVDGPLPEAVTVETKTYAAESDGYRVEMQESVVDGRRYFDWAHATR